MSAATACRVIAAAASASDDVGAVDEAPLADGGEGTLDALAQPLDLTLATSVVRGMLGGETVARWGRKGPLAVVEAAEAVGLALVPPARRDPWRATTYGVGELIAHAARAGAEHVIVCLGGSGTVDGGQGMRDALAELLPPAASPKLTALVDVDVPLDGARMFMRQKLGPTQSPAHADQLVDALAGRLAAMYDDDVAATAGAGAAGGLGAAIVHLGGALVPGAPWVMDALRLEERIARADVVVTGEGRVDEQTVHGKAIAALARSCRARGKQLVAFAGATSGDLAPLHALGVDDVRVITPSGQPTATALAHAHTNLAVAARAFFASLPRA